MEPAGDHHLSDGGSSETWVYKNWILLPIRFSRYPGDGPLSPERGRGENTADYAKGDFPNLSWITGEKFAGVRTVREHRCNIFQDGSGPEAKGQANQLEAAIDSTSGLPVQIRNGAVTQVYSYQESPPLSLELPPRFCRRARTVSDHTKQTVFALDEMSRGPEYRRERARFVLPTLSLRHLRCRRTSMQATISTID